MEEPMCFCVLNWNWNGYFKSLIIRQKFLPIRTFPKWSLCRGQRRIQQATLLGPSEDSTPCMIEPSNLPRNFLKAEREKERHSPLVKTAAMLSNMSLMLSRRLFQCWLSAESQPSTFTKSLNCWDKTARREDYAASFQVGNQGCFDECDLHWQTWKWVKNKRSDGSLERMSSDQFTLVI